MSPALSRRALLAAAAAAPMLASAPAFALPQVGPQAKEFILASLQASTVS